MLKIILCNYTDTYILLQGTITIIEAERAGDDAARRGVRETDKGNKGVILKSCAIFTDFISKIYSTQVYNAKDLDVVMPMYKLIEYSDNYS